MLRDIILGLIIIALTVSLQGFASNYWVNFLYHKFEKLPTNFDSKFRTLLIQTGGFLLILNFLQSFIWALTFYLHPNITEFETLEKAVYFSLVTFTTLGYGDITMESGHRILAGLEAINGVLLLGWSTTMMYSLVQLIMRKLFEEKAGH